MRTRSCGLVVIALAASVACAATVLRGSGNVVSRSIAVTPFSRMEVGDAFDVTLTIGAAETVAVRMDDNLVDRLDARVAGGVLHLGLRGDVSVHDATLRAAVVARSLIEVTVSGAGRVHLSGGWAEPRLRLAASGAGVFDGAIDAERATLDLSGASTATVSGTASMLTVVESGASRLEGEALRAVDLAATLSGASSATLSVTGTIAADLSGASSLRYRGEARIVQRQVSGGSSLSGS
jgi:hypothetical protein